MLMLVLLKYECLYIHKYIHVVICMLLVLYNEWIKAEEQQEEEEELVPEVPPVVWPGGPIDTSLLTRYHEYVARHV
ncbi:unnamed protein product [Trifolium pratense]|uniref:Uncharacterized protein n=1 Tax=Trifolium pratense TaxID=57577 RepID=A0ACB0KTK0_TRIPR|nr:unnamed protein product [Trifolium pratense]